MDGKVDVDEFDKQQAEEEKLEKVKQEIRTREQQEALQKGRPGKGNQRGYIRFCRYCFTEYLIDITKCNKCNRDTMT